MKDFFGKLKQMFNVRDLFFVSLIFGLMLLMAFCSAETMMDVTFGETAVDITTAKYSMNIPYDMIESIELGQTNKDDKGIDADYDFALRTGLWKSESWGEYYACVDMEPTLCILVHLNDGRLFVFSHDNDKTVLAEFDTLQGYLDALSE